MTLTRAVLALLLSFGAQAAHAADLDTVRGPLMALRDRAETPARTLRPEFLTARDQLGLWIESRLEDLRSTGEVDGFLARLNTEIAAADLACKEAASPGYNRCASPGDLDARGYLGAIDGGMIRGFLVVQAEVGIACGFDETAYIFERTKTGWRRLFDTAQKPDANGRYIPEQVQILTFTHSPKMPTDATIFLVGGAQPVCAGSFRPVHYRVWTARPGTAATLHIDGRELNAFTGRRDPPVSARFEGDDLLVEMDVGSIDPSRHARVAVRRFTFENESFRRMAPLALSPRDFVEEWLSAPWRTAAEWTQDDQRKPLEAVHARVQKESSRARFSGATQRCEKTEGPGKEEVSGQDQGGVVQVGVRFASGETFFRVKNDPAGAYQMLAADSDAAPTCRAADASLDAPRTLF